MAWSGIYSIAAQEAAGVLIRIAGAMFLSRQRNVDCGYSNMFEVSFCTMCLKFPKFLYMRFVEQTADKRCKSKIQKLLFNASPWIRAELPSISEHRYRFLGPDWTGCKTRRLASSLLQATGAAHKDLRKHWLWPRWRTKLRL